MSELSKVILTRGGWTRTEFEVWWKLNNGAWKQFDFICKPSTHIILECSGMGTVPVWAESTKACRDLSCYNNIILNINTTVADAEDVDVLCNSFREIWNFIFLKRAWLNVNSYQRIFHNVRSNNI